jgi:hypothetical protein
MKDGVFAAVIEEDIRVRRAAIFCVLSVLCAGIFAGLIPFRVANADQASGAPAASGAVAVAMKNVEFHLTDNIIVHVATLNGKMTSTHGEIPVLDDKRSFVLDIDSAKVAVSMTALANDLNDYVFAKPDAPLKKLNATTQGQLLVVKGLLVSKGGIPFETDGTLSVTPEGMIRVHTQKVKALKVPVKGLMDMLGIDTANLLTTKKVEGVTVDKDDLILDPSKILPPPELTGHLVSIDIVGGQILLGFKSSEGPAKQSAVVNSCPARNYLTFKGGSVRFGKLTMSDTDLELIDSDPGDSFDFSIDHYKDQLVAGYAKMTRQGGLCVQVPDFNKVKPNGNSQQKGNPKP